MNRLTAAADRLAKGTEWLVPSAFSIAVLLTGVAATLALLLTPSSSAEVLRAWGGGFPELLAFSMQMALVMFTGYLLALTRPVAALLDVVARAAKSPRQAVVLMALASMSLAYVNWGLSIVASAMLVRAVVKRQPEVDYRLLVACAYFGLGATWHAGFSASAPLVVAAPKHDFVEQMGVITIDRTLFSPFNLGLTLFVMALLTGFAWVMHPPPSKTVRIDPSLLDSFRAFEAPPKPQRRTFATLFDHSPVLNAAFAAAALVFLGFHFADKGLRGLNINVVNFIFLSLAVALHGTPARLLKAAEEAGSVLHGVVLQFPLYAGIYGIFSATKLTERLGDFFVSICTKETFPVVVYWYSGLVNYFVPSGGAKWAIEASYLVNAATRLGVAPEKVVLAYAWGDMATDLIQPFWALPLLAVAKLEFKDVLGFLLLAFLLYLPCVSLAFWLFG